jgi:hypothetical protein
MLSALLYLRVTSLKNQFLGAIKRLKEPKYLLGTAAGLLYFYYFFIRTVNGHLVDLQNTPAVRAVGFAPPTFSRDQFIGAGTCILCVITLLKLGWFIVYPPLQPGLKFSEAEIAFLFPAPLTRKKLIHFNLLSSQSTILISSLFLTLVFGRDGLSVSANVFRALGWWIILSSFNLFSIGSGLYVSRMLQRAAKPMMYRIAVAGLLLFTIKYIVSTFLNIARVTPDFVDPITSTLFQANLVIKSGSIHWLFLPFEIIVKPFFSTQWNVFINALAFAIGLLSLLYFWILNMEVSFEEGSLIRAEKRSAVRAAIASGKAPINASVKDKVFKDPFHLVSLGTPEVAFLWKNLISIQAWFNIRVIFILIGPAVFGALLSVHDSGSVLNMTKVIKLLALCVASVTVFAGPQVLRQDLRSDLTYMDMLKTYPMKGWQIVLGEIITPVVVMTTVLYLCLFAFVFLSHVHLNAIAQLLAGLIVIPAFCALQLLIPNAAALIFPGIALTVSNRRGGIEVIGQRLIFVFGQLIAIAFALIPAVLLGIAVFISMRWWAGLIMAEDFAKVVATLIGSVTCFALIIGEISFALWWLGHRFDTFDLSKELPQGSV